MVYINCDCGNTAGCEKCMPENYRYQAPHRFYYKKKKYIVIDGELYELVDEAPPGMKLMPDDAAILSVR